MIDEDRFQNCVRDFSSSVSVQTGLKHSGWVSLVIHCSAGMRRIRSILEVEQLGHLYQEKEDEFTIRRQLHRINGIIRLK